MESVIFDLYGTLVQFGVQHHPYRRVLQWAREQGRRPKPDDARTLMTIDDSPQRVFSQMGIELPDKMVSRFDRDLQEELDSLTLYDDVRPALAMMREEGIPVGICSNLAQPYGRVIQNLLADEEILVCLSYQVGAIKPEAEIYNWLLDRSGIDDAEQILFVGDNLVADVEGPTRIGMHALHLQRGKVTSGNAINSLSQLAMASGRFFTRL